MKLTKICQDYKRGESLAFFILQEVEKMTEKASTTGLQKAMEQKQQAKPMTTGVDPYKKAQSYLKAMAPAITEALPKCKGMDAERLSSITLTTLRTNPKLLECSVESLLGAVLQSCAIRP